MPVNIHVADPIWMYEKMDSTNDGLMNAQTWRIDLSKPGFIGFDVLIRTLENAVKDNPKTTFIACHFANLNHDLEKLGLIFDVIRIFMPISPPGMQSQHQYQGI